MAIAAVVFGLSRLMSGGIGANGEGDVVGFIRIQGGIFDAKDTVASLDKLRRNPRVKSLLLRIDSPGGAVGPTQEIYEEIQRFRRSGRKVVASLGSVAASGGYYLASAADMIYAYPGTITGSIGVVVVLPNAEEMLGKVGLKFNVIKYCVLPLYHGAATLMVASMAIASGRPPGDDTDRWPPTKTS